jgi:AcrR family transcriptional regulator
VSTRDRLLDAAADVLRAQGLSRTTTKEIARAAGCSEALLYKHFRDKWELLLAVLEERMPAFAEGLTPAVGSIESNLTAIARSALAFYQQTFPMMGSVLTDPRLMAATRESLHGYGAGPQQIVTGVADYLDAERRLGRVAPDADPAACAALLIGACFQQVFLHLFAQGPGGPGVPGGSAESLVRPLLPALSPRPAGSGCGCGGG